MKRIAQAFALAAILLLPNYIDLTSGVGDARMRVPVPLTRIALAHLTDLVLVTFIVFGLLGSLRRLPAWPQVRWALLGLLPVLLLARNLDVIPFEVSAAAVVAIGVTWTLVLALLILKAPRVALLVRQAGSVVLTMFAFFALMMVWQLGRAAMWRPGPQSFRTGIDGRPTHNKRLVWILFDELAYQPTFETRDPSLRLPNFDRLRGESTLYTSMTPIADRTTRAVPSLLLGRMVTDVAAIRRTMSTWCKRRISLTGGSFDAKATLFGIATQRGLTTSITGWYIAYCPVFAGVVTDCYWNNEDTQDRGPTWLNASYAENVWFPLRILVEQAYCCAGTRLEGCR